LQPTGLIQDMNQRLLSIGYNLRFSFAEPVAKEIETIHIQLDDSTIPLQLSRYPLDRFWLAGVIDQVSSLNPGLIILNIILDRPTIDSHDQALAASFQQAGNVIIRESSRLPTLHLFKKSVRASGVLKLKEDSTSTIRMVCNSKKSCGKADILHQQVWDILHPDKSYSESFPESDWLAINFHRTPPAFINNKTLSLDKILSNSGGTLNKQIVIIGGQFESITPGLKTPLTLTQSDLSSESEIFGQMLNMLATRKLITKFSPVASTIMLGLILLVLGSLSFHSYYTASIGLWIGSLICWITTSSLLFSFYNVDIPFFLPTLEISFFTIVLIFTSLSWEKINNLDKALTIEKQKTLLKEAKINHLTGQMNAHNVFNEFSRIKGMITVDPEKAKIYLLNFANMLKYSLMYSDKPSTPLEYHTDFIRYYLSQQESINDRFQFHMDFKVTDENIKLPWNVLFPLVENAVKYSENLDRDNHPDIKINLVLSNNNDNLDFVVKNPFDESVSPESTGTGIRNLKERLAFFYEEKAFSLEAKKEGSSWSSLLRLPLQH
jgi:sensor histidine kinase YesM